MSNSNSFFFKDSTVVLTWLSCKSQDSGKGGNKNLVRWELTGRENFLHYMQVDKIDTECLGRHTVKSRNTLQNQSQGSLPGLWRVKSKSLEQGQVNKEPETRQGTQQTKARLKLLTEPPAIKLKISSLLLACSLCGWTWDPWKTSMARPKEWGGVSCTSYLPQSHRLFCILGFAISTEAASLARCHHRRNKAIPCRNH
jgi:hypothetical protein